MGQITVVDRNGERSSVDAVVGWRVMEIIKTHGYDMEALCGGACMCATCHVIVNPGWESRLFEPRPDEQDRIDDLENPLLGSRLSCQIIWSDELNGLEVRLPE